MSTASDPGSASLELARRLLEHVPFGPKVELVAGGLPARLAGELPLPTGASLLGSALNTWDARRPTLEAVFDAPGDPAPTLTAYQHQLQELGWEIVEGAPGPPRGGFFPGRRSEGVLMRRPGRGPVLRAAAVEGDRPQMADLRVILDWEMPRHMAESPVLHHPPGQERLPALYPPRGVTVHPQGGGGSGGRWNQQALAYTDRSAADVEGQFAGQLASAGWTKLDGRAEDTVAWSSWKLPGEPEWRGLLLVIALFGTAQRSLWLGIEAAEPEEDRGTTHRR